MGRIKKRKRMKRPFLTAFLFFSAMIFPFSSGYIKLMQRSHFAIEKRSARTAAARGFLRKLDDAAASMEAKPKEYDGGEEYRND